MKELASVALPILIGFIEKGADYVQSLKKAEQQRLDRLKREVRGNLAALKFARRDGGLLPELGTKEFAVLAKNLDNTAAREACTENFTAKRPRKSPEKKKALVRYTRYALVYVAEQVDDLKKLAVYEEGQRLPAVRLTTRLGKLAEHLERLEKILDGLPVKLPSRKAKAGMQKA